MKVEQFDYYLGKANLDLYDQRGEINPEIADDFTKIDSQEMMGQMRYRLREMKASTVDAEIINKIANFERYLDIVDERNKRTRISEDKNEQHNTIQYYEMYKQLLNIMKMMIEG